MGTSRSRIGKRNNLRREESCVCRVGVEREGECPGFWGLVGNHDGVVVGADGVFYNRGGDGGFGGVIGVVVE